ncbi:uncharacterized protein LOC141619231 [Silene latifolia]|uniref:uncharacterized protein LOC141619231 n=1 Tax=Silene latifolia TaxID=37657 RepID=UPI003D7758DE
MARSSSSKTNSATKNPKTSSPLPNNNQKKTGPSPSEVNKEKNVNEIVGLAPFDLEIVEVDENGEEWVTQGKKRKTLASIPEEPKEMLQFTVEDVRDELNFWKPSSKEAVLKQGHFLFDNKPPIVRNWTANIELTKDNVKNVPVWIKLWDLRLKFWGKCLPRIAGLVGKYIRSDVSTMEKTRLGFARVLIEVPFSNKLPASVLFLDEFSQEVKIDVESEWKPILCTECGEVGHDSLSCRKPKQKMASKPVPTTQKWVPKQKTVNVPQPILVTSAVSVSDTPVVSKTPKEIQHKLQVSWSKDGKYGQPPAKPVTTLSRQDIIRAGKATTHLCQYTFQHALNNAAKKSGVGSVLVNDPPRVGVGTSGSALLPPGVMHNIGFWNVRGLNSSSKQKQVKWKSLWHDLCSFADSIHDPWILCGDFNCVLKSSERLGGSSSDEEMKDFQECLDYCQMIDSPAAGSYYTWNNKQEPQTRVYSRLDRVLVNNH